MPDVLQEYEEYLRRSLLDDFGLASSQGSQSSLGNPLCQAIFRPSFHPEVCVRMDRSDSGGRVRLTTMQTNLWYWSQYRRGQERGEPWDGDVPTAPEAWEESAEFDEARLAQLCRELDSCAQLIPAEEDGVYLDGIRVDLELTIRQGDLIRASFCCPSADTMPASRGASLAVLTLAMEALRDERSLRVLENLCGYGLGLPGRDPPARGNP